VTIDSAAMQTALEQSGGAIILFDFKAAFPSIAPDYLFETLKHMGLPGEALRLVTSLYDSNRCQLSFKGQSYPGFSMTGGVRQGCPLSPLLYAIAADALLEKICTMIPEAVVRAYADDTAIVLTDFWKQAPLLASIFEEFGALSNLRRNYEKCVVIPLNPVGLRPPGVLASSQVSPDEGPLRRLSHDLKRLVPIWSNMTIDWAGTYLGFVVGPGKGEETWRKPVAKYMERCRMWAGRGQGLQYSVIAYNAFAISTLSYVAQLEAPPSWAYQHEVDMLRESASGPKDWASASDL
jgi:hypothetical protein